MYSGLSIGDAKKKYVKLQLMNRAPFFASDMVLLTIFLFYNRLDVGEPAGRIQ